MPKSPPTGSTSSSPNAWLTLKGEVKDQSASDAAFAAVSALPGVGGITNEIKVITAGARRLNYCGPPGAAARRAGWPSVIRFSDRRPGTAITQFA